MVWRRRRRELRGVARNTGLRSPSESAPGVTTLARHCCVCAGQQEAAQVVIELRSAPILIGVAGLTRRWETRGAMIRIGGAIEIRRVTAKTV